MTRKPVVDRRLELRISQQTWDREPQRLVEAADQLGLRLVVVPRSGEAWKPDPDPQRW